MDSGTQRGPLKGVQAEEEVASTCLEESMP